MNKFVVITGVLLLSLIGIAPISGQNKEVFFADPTLYSENGKYYLTGTRSEKPLGFSVLESTNLKTWKTPSGKEIQLVLKPGNTVFGEHGFWAPQIIKEDKSYFLTYTANEQIALASSATLTGPYQQQLVAPVDGSEKNIDSYLFKDDDGKYYLYHVRFNKGNFLWVAEFDLSAGKIKPETLRQCFSNTEAWEATPNYKSDPIMEGPTVVKMKGLYYLFYSANHFENIDYAVGYATATSPVGPWIKNPNNPIIHRSIVGENGSGHGDLFFDKHKKPYYVYHVHFSDSKVSPRRTRIVPLQFNFNKTTGIYDITVKGKKVIVPEIR
jgi:beta-xylosidase